MANRTTVLVVEDDDEQRDLLCKIVVEDGYYALGFAEGELLLRYLARADPASVLIVLDLMLPPPDGWQLLRDVKSEARFAKVPVVICSAAADQEQILRYAGIEAFLAKPYDPADLLDVVRKHCKRSVQGPGAAANS